MSRDASVHMKDEGAVALESALADPALRSLTLDLSGFARYDSLVLWLARLPWSDVEDLTALLADPEFGDEAALAIGMAGLPSSLASLSLCDSGVGTPGLSQLLPAIPGSVATLSLAGNRLDDASVVALLAKPPRGLVDLDLSRNSIGDLGARALARMPVAAKLARLDLMGNPIGDTGRTALAERFGTGVRISGL